MGKLGGILSFDLFKTLCNVCIYYVHVKYHPFDHRRQFIIISPVFFCATGSSLRAACLSHNHGVHSLYCHSGPVVGLQEIPGAIPLSFNLTNN